MRRRSMGRRFDRLNSHGSRHGMFDEPDSHDNHDSHGSYLSLAKSLGSMLGGSTNSTSKTSAKVYIPSHLPAVQAGLTRAQSFHQHAASLAKVQPSFWQRIRGHDLDARMDAARLNVVTAASQTQEAALRYIKEGGPNSQYGTGRLYGSLVKPVLDVLLPYLGPYKDPEHARNLIGDIYSDVKNLGPMERLLFDTIEQRVDQEGSTHPLTILVMAYQAAPENIGALADKYLTSKVPEADAILPLIEEYAPLLIEKLHKFAENVQSDQKSPMSNIASYMDEVVAKAWASPYPVVMLDDLFSEARRELDRHIEVESAPHKEIAQGIAWFADSAAYLLEDIQESGVLTEIQKDSSQ